MNNIDKKAVDYVTTKFGEKWANGNSTMQEHLTLEFEYEESCIEFQRWLSSGSGTHKILESYRYNRFIRLKRAATGDLHLYTAFDAME